MPGIGRVGAPLAVAVALLAGCAPMPPAATTATTTPRPTTIAEPQPETAPTLSEPAPTGPPPIDTLVLTADGLGPLRLGSVPVVSEPATDVVLRDPDYCEWNDDPGWRAQWVANYPPLPGGPSVFDVGDTVEGIVAAIGVYSDVGIRTDRGIGIGSSRADVLAAYPEATLGERGTAYFVPGGTGWLSMTVLDAETAAGASEPADTVILLEARTTMFEVWATDGGAGAC